MRKGFFSVSQNRSIASSMACQAFSSRPDLQLVCHPAEEADQLRFDFAREMERLGRAA